MPIHELTKAGTSESSFVDLFLEGRSVATIRSYRSDLADFATFLGVESLHDAALRLLGDGPATANVLALRYVNALRERGLKSATQNRRLASLRSLVSLARTVGLVNWALEVRGPRVGLGVGLGVRSSVHRLHHPGSTHCRTTLANTPVSFHSEEVFARFSLRTHESLGNFPDPRDSL
ncbi:MAG: site-specific integrase [Thermoanaerobaculia bacterium]